MQLLCINCCSPDLHPQVASYSHCHTLRSTSQVAYHVVGRPHPDAVAGRMDPDDVIADFLTRFPSTSSSSLKESFEEALQRNDVKAIIVTGKGGKFSGGFDISSFGGLQGGKMEQPKVGYILIDILTDTLQGATKPAMAAIDGLALGGGLEVAMACHAHIWTPKAQLGLPELQLGVILGFEGNFMCQHVLRERARKLDQGIRMIRYRVGVTGTMTRYMSIVADVSVENYSAPLTR